MTNDITIAELVRNGTMSAEIAAVLWAAVDEQASFLTVAIPQRAGKSTTSNAVLALRPPEVAVHPVTGQPSELERLQRERLGGYIVVGEFSRAPVPGYIWGEPVRRVFDTLSAGYSLQTSLHAPSVQAAVQQVTVGNGVSDEQASAFKLVVYIEMFGRSWADVTRRVADVYELQGVERGHAVGQSLFRWQQDGDRFEQVGEARQFGRDTADLQRRARTIATLAESGRTTTEDVAAAIEQFRLSRSG